MTARFDAGNKRFGVYALDRLLAGRIDRRQEYAVGIVEAGGEFLEQAGRRE
jgi:hypothetical protein